MSPGHMAELDQPASPLRFTSPINATSMTFLHRGQTQAQVIAVLHQAIYEPESRANRIEIVVSQAQVMFTFLVCAYMLWKKQSLGKLWIIARRPSPYGTFYVANAVFSLVITAATYMAAWFAIAVLAAAFSFANIGTLNWWWIIPLPWYPLVTGAYVSIHGFVVGCSPNSPLSSVNRHAAQEREQRFYMPIPKSSTIVNTVLVLPLTLFTASTIGLVTLSGRAHFHAKALQHSLFSPQVNALLSKYAMHPDNVFEGHDALASDELLWAGRRVTAAYFESHRYVCINLAVFAAMACMLYTPVLVYALPNLASLVDHACSRFPGELPDDCEGFIRKFHFFLTTGRPKADETSAHINISTWKMTILAITYVVILVVCVPVFACIPIFIIVLSFPKGVQEGDISLAIQTATICVRIATIFACTFFAIFCTVATLDPLFRAAIGLNMIRNTIAIDINVTKHEQRENAAADVAVEGMPLSPTFRTSKVLALRPSMSTLVGSTKSPVKEEFSECPKGNDIRIVVDDADAGR